MNSPSIQIQGRKIGYDNEPLVIAEIGINHNGNLSIAKEMVDAAHAAGVEVIKHQTHIVEDEMTEEAKKIKPGNADKSIYAIMQECALSEADEYELMQYVTEKGMIFISTPFSGAALERLIKFDIPAIKIGSGECNNLPLIEKIARFGKPVIMSTGMNTIDSIKVSVKILNKFSIDYALLHTTNLYPTPNHLVRLGALSEMIQTFPDAVIGLSDHTTSNHACFGAVALGASVLERHFTDSMDREGPDIICSMDKKACIELIEGSKILYQQRGGKKGPAKEEQVTIDFAFASVCTTCAINKGEIFSRHNLWVRRPGIGDFKASSYESLLGKRAKTHIPENVLLKKSDVE